MEDEKGFRVCPVRNVPAAFQRFFGRDSGGMERFFPQAHQQFCDTQQLAAVAALEQTSVKAKTAWQTFREARWVLHFRPA